MAKRRHAQRRRTELAARGIHLEVTEKAENLGKTKKASHSGPRRLRNKGRVRDYESLAQKNWARATAVGLQASRTNKACGTRPN